MAHMRNISSAPEDRMQADRRELAGRIARVLPHEGVIESRPALHFRRHSAPTTPTQGVSDPAFCVIAQGCKDIHFGSATLRYDSAHYLITTMEVRSREMSSKPPRRSPT